MQNDAASNAMSVPGGGRGKIPSVHQTAASKAVTAFGLTPPNPVKPGARVSAGPGAAGARPSNTYSTSDFTVTMSADNNFN